MSIAREAIMKTAGSRGLNRSIRRAKVTDSKYRKAKKRSLEADSKWVKGWTEGKGKYRPSSDAMHAASDAWDLARMNLIREVLGKDPGASPVFSRVKHALDSGRRRSFQKIKSEVPSLDKSEYGRRALQRHRDDRAALQNSVDKIMGPIRNRAYLG